MTMEYTGPPHRLIERMAQENDQQVKVTLS